MNDIKNCQILLFLLLFSAAATAQSHFTSGVKNTGSNMTLLARKIIKPRCNGESLHNGDEIGVFTESGLCIGSTIWRNANTVVTIWGDNPVTEEKDGAGNGEALKVRIWCNQLMRELDAVARIASGKFIYRADGIVKLTYLATVDDASSKMENKNKPAENTASSDDGNSSIKKSKSVNANNIHGSKIGAVDGYADTEKKTTTEKIDPGTPLYPVNESVPENKAVEFKWKNGIHFKNGFIEISPDSTFGTITQKIPIVQKEKKKNVHIKEEGEFWWRLKYTSGENKMTVSQSAKFTLFGKILFPDKIDIAIKSNPVVKKITINCYLPDSSDITLTVTDKKGNVIKKVEENKQHGARTFSILTDSLKNDTYYYSIETDAFFYKSYFSISDTKSFDKEQLRRK